MLTTFPILLSFFFKSFKIYKVFLKQKPYKHFTKTIYEYIVFLMMKTWIIEIK